MVDVVTHAGIGCVLAAPFLATSSEAAAAIAFGSVLPDLDALSRVFGKRAFLACHQTWSHALPVIALLGAVVAAAVSAYDGPGLVVGAGLAAGMVIHSLLDLTNTFGIALLLPAQTNRRCLELMFFVDAGTMAITTGALVWITVIIGTGGVPGWPPTLAWLTGMTLWLVVRYILRSRAQRIAPAGTKALIPSAWNPFRFYGTAAGSTELRLFTIDGLAPVQVDERLVPIHDAEVSPEVLALPEIVAMRRLTPVYHAMSLVRDGVGTRITFRDSRIRNFATSFGVCDILLTDGQPPRVTFHV